MSKFKEEIFNDLMKVIEKMADIESREGLIFSDDAYVHLSYAMEQLSGFEGITNEEIKKYKGSYLRNNEN
jgi:hypothetical protein